MTARLAWLAFAVLATAAFGEWVLSGTAYAQEAAQSEGGHDFVFRFSIFVLAIFVGYYVVWSVTPALHTPLMSLTNAISAIAVVGSILLTGGDYPIRIRILGAIALFASMTNIVGGFLITDRMLRMFKTDRKPGDGSRP